MGWFETVGEGGTLLSECLMFPFFLRNYKIKNYSARKILKQFGKGENLTEASVLVSALLTRDLHDTLKWETKTKEASLKT